MSETSVCLSLHRSASFFNKSFPNSSSGAVCVVFFFGPLVEGTTIFGIFLCFFGSVEQDALAPSLAGCWRCRGSGRFAGAVTSLSLVGTVLTTIGAGGIAFLMMRSFGTLGTFAGVASVGCGAGEFSFLFSTAGSGISTGSGILTGSGVLTGSGGGVTTGSGAATGSSGSMRGSGSGTATGSGSGSGSGTGTSSGSGTGSGSLTGSRTISTSSGGVMGSGNSMGSPNPPGSGIEMGSGNASGSGNVRGSDEIGTGSSAVADAAVGHAGGGNATAIGSVKIGSIDAVANAVGRSTVGMKGRGSGGGFCNNGKKCSCGSTKGAAGGAFDAAAARATSSSSVTSDPMMRTRVSQGDSPGGILANVVSFARITTTLSSETLAGVKDVTRGRETLAYVMVDHALGAGNRTPRAPRSPLQNIIVRASKNARQHDAAK
ncbi:m117.1 protein [Murid betaherpesvirus 1]|nr:m117.1 protein [Murid betaherpesvirus 1]